MIWFCRSRSGLRARSSLPCPAKAALPSPRCCVRLLRFLRAPLRALRPLRCSEECRKDSRLELHCFAGGLWKHSCDRTGWKRALGHTFSLLQCAGSIYAVILVGRGLSRGRTCRQARRLTGVSVTDTGLCTKRGSGLRVCCGRWRCTATGKPALTSFLWLYLT